MRDYFLKNKFKDYAQVIEPLRDPELVTRILPKDTVFATIASVAKVTGELKQRLRAEDGVRVWQWYGLDDENKLTGYLSRSGTNLRFQTPSSILFDLPFSELRVKPHLVGPIISLPDGEYALGDFLPINEQLSPSAKAIPRFGGNRTIWLNELADIGAIDKRDWQRSQTRRKIFTYSWFVLFCLALAFVLVYLIAVK